MINMTSSTDSNYFDIGRIIMIPNSKTIIVKPKEDIILSVGDKLAVYEKAIDIIDPETEEKLGQYAVDKDVMEVVEANDKFVICKNFTTRKATEAFRAISPFLIGEYKEYHQFVVNEEENMKISLENSEIRIGDKVRRL